MSGLFALSLIISVFGVAACAPKKPNNAAGFKASCICVIGADASTADVPYSRQMVCRVWQYLAVAVNVYRVID